MGDVIVKYNNLQISPTPLVSRTYQFIDYGGRWGQAEQIELSCYLTGITGTGVISRIVDVFSGQFKTLEVFEDTTSIYKWDNVLVEEINIPNSHFSPGTVGQYTTKLISYQVPSGVVDPINEYGFTQNEDGTVNVTHRISAKGIKTISTPLNNAINFVKLFVGKNPFTSCVPAFILNGSGILINLSETIDRASCVYTVNELYKYTTGSTNAYIENSSLNVNESKNDDYVKLDLNLKWQGSPINNNISSLQVSLSNLDIFQKLKDFGITTKNVYQDTFNITQDSGQSTLEIRASFLSGASNDFSGYFDYGVSVDRDIPKNLNEWKIDGEFICKGPVSFRQNRINSFKTSNQSSGSYITYLKNLLVNSSLYDSISNNISLNPNPSKLTIIDDTGSAIFRLSASFNNKDSYNELLFPKYSVEIEPSKWIYEMLPAANIEGHYILQDLQMRNQAKIKINLSSNTSGTKKSNLDKLYEIANNLSGIHVLSGFLVNESINSGIYEVELNLELLGQNLIGSNLLDSKVHGSVSMTHSREPGFKFGY